MPVAAGVEWGWEITLAWLRKDRHNPSTGRVCRTSSISCLLLFFLSPFLSPPLPSLGYLLLHYCCFLQERRGIFWVGKCRNGVWRTAGECELWLIRSFIKLFSTWSRLIRIPRSKFWGERSSAPECKEAKPGVRG